MYNRMQHPSQNGSHVSANTQPPVPEGQQPLYIQTTGPRTYKLASTAFIRLGITQIVIGIVTIAFQVATIIVTLQPTFGLSGIYCPILYIIAGGFGIASGKRNTMCPTVAFLVLCIISAVFTISQLASGVTAAMVQADSYIYLGGIYHFCFGAAIVLAILAVVECLIAIVCASLCCKAVCCGYANDTMVAYTRNAAGETMIPLMVVQNASSSSAAGMNVMVQPMSGGLGPQKIVTQSSIAPPIAEKHPVN